MYEKIKRLAIKHTGMFLFVSVIIFALIVITIEIMQRLNINTNEAVGLVQTIENNEANIYNNKILNGSQVISAIKKYYNNQQVIMLLFNNKSDYNMASYRFFVTDKTANFSQDASYNNVIISNNYNDITSIFVKDTSIGFLNNHNKPSLDSYSNSNSKNYISLNSKYKATLVKCNGVNLGMAFFKIS